MQYSQLILEYMAKNKMTAYKMSQITGLSESTFSKWKSNPTSKIPIDSIKKIADYFHVTISALLGESESFLNEDENQLLKTFNSLDEQGKLMVQAKAVEELRRLEK